MVLLLYDVDTLYTYKFQLVFLPQQLKEELSESLLLHRFGQLLSSRSISELFISLDNTLDKWHWRLPSLCWSKKQQHTNPTSQTRMYELLCHTRLQTSHTNRNKLAVSGEPAQPQPAMLESLAQTKCFVTATGTCYPQKVSSLCTAFWKRHLDN